MRRIVRWAGIVAALLFVVLLSAPFWIDANTFRPMLEADLSDALGREVKLGDLKLAVFSGAVTANDLSVADDPLFNRTPFVRAKSLKLAIELWPLLFSHKLNVTGLTIDQPDITLMQAPSGDWNFSKLGTKSARAEHVERPSGKASLQLSVKLVKISGGRFSLGRTGGRLKPFVLEGLDAELRDFSDTTAFPFSVSAKVTGGGDIKLEGSAGPLDPVNVAVTPVKVSLNVSQLDLSGSGLTEASPGLAGLITLDGTGESKSGVAQVKGKLKAEKLRLAKAGTAARPAVELDFEIVHDLRSQSGRLRSGDIHIGKALANLTGSYSRHGESTVLKMNLSGPAMPIPELAQMLPAMGIVLPAGSSLQGGTARANFDLEGPTDRLVTSGSLAFNNTKLTGFNLGTKMSMIERLAGIQGTPDTEIQTMSSNLRMAPDGMAADNLKLVVPALGELNGGGTISPANVLDFKMTAAVHTGGMIAALNDRPVPFFIGGTCSDPVFRPDVRAIVTDEVKKQGTKAAGSFLKGLLGGKDKH